MGQVSLDSKLLLETVEKGGVHGTLSFSLSKYLCSTAARWILEKMEMARFLPWRSSNRVNKLSHGREGFTQIPISYLALLVRKVGGETQMGEWIRCRLSLKKLTVRKCWGQATMCHGEGPLGIPRRHQALTG